jgi:hypothetical protein
MAHSSATGSSLVNFDKLMGKILGSKAKKQIKKNIAAKKAAAAAAALKLRKKLGELKPDAKPKGVGIGYYFLQHIEQAMLSKAGMIRQGEVADRRLSMMVKRAYVNGKALGIYYDLGYLSKQLGVPLVDYFAMLLKIGGKVNKKVMKDARLARLIAEMKINCDAHQDCTPPKPRGLKSGKLKALFKKGALRHIFKRVAKPKKSKKSTKKCICTQQSENTRHGRKLKNGQQIIRMGSFCRLWEVGDKKPWCYVPKSCKGAKKATKLGRMLPRYYQWCPPARASGALDMDVLKNAKTDNDQSVVDQKRKAIAEAEGSAAGIMGHANAVIDAAPKRATPGEDTLYPDHYEKPWAYPKKPSTKALDAVNAALAKGSAAAATKVTNAAKVLAGKKIVTINVAQALANQAFEYAEEIEE